MCITVIRYNAPPTPTNALFYLYDSATNSATLFEIANIVQQSEADFQTQENQMISLMMPLLEKQTVSKALMHQTTTKW